MPLKRFLKLKVLPDFGSLRFINEVGVVVRKVFGMKQDYR